VSLRTEYDADRHLVRISVVDNGEGMSEELQQKLFEPFTSTKGLRGTGLGLVVTRKVVEEHGGRVDIESEPATGSTFTLTLPVSTSAVGSANDTMGPAFSESSMRSGSEEGGWGV